MKSRTLEAADAVNRPILDAALVDHEKHMRALCHWIRQRLKTPWGKRHLQSGPNAISDLCSEGHTAATVMWEMYGGEECPK